MKLPSIDELINSSKKAFLRFPFAIIFSIFAAFFGIYLIELNETARESIIYVNLMLTSLLGIPLFIAVKLYYEKFDNSKLLFYVAYGVSILLLVFIYFSLPESKLNVINNSPYIKYAIYNIVIHLMVAFLPYLNKNEENGFWNYNKTLFLRFLETNLYSGVLYIGIVVALFAVDTLFELKLDGNLYGEIFVFIATVFNTWFFASKIPNDFSLLQNTYEYPKGLKIFTQFILLPLLIAYLIILYAYELKILVFWDWPKGIVSYLVIIVATIGIITFLLIYPYGNNNQNKWIKRFTKSYYLTLIPLVAMLFIAIFIRIDDYGITVNRYLICLLGLWLLALIIYFLIGKTSIKFIPISLAVILIAASFGPWGMFSVSESSQLSRLDEILHKSNLLQNGKIKNEVIWEKDSLPGLFSDMENINSKNIDSSANYELHSIVQYLVEFHNYKELNQYFKQDLTQLIDSKNEDDYYVYSPYNVYNTIMKTMGLPNIYLTKTYQMTTFNVKEKNELDIEGFSKLIKIEYYNIKNVNGNPILNDSYRINEEINSDNIFQILVKGNEISFDLSSIISIVKSSDNSYYEVDNKVLSFYTEKDDVAYKLQIENLDLGIKNKIIRFNGVILIGEANKEQNE